MSAKVFIRATVPDVLVKDYLQHLRNFDVAHDGCHFEILIDGQEMPIAQMLETLRVNPGFKFQHFFERKQ